MSNNQPPQPDFGEQGRDETTDRIREVIETMGGTAIGYTPLPPDRPMAEWAKGLPEEVVAGVLRGDPEAVRIATEAKARDTARQLKRKAFFFRRYADDESTPAGKDANTLDNIIAIGNSDEEPATERVLGKVKRFLFGAAEPDRFAIQDLGTQYATAILNGAEDLDLADLAVALHASAVYDNALLEGKTPEEVHRATPRYNDLERAYVVELVAAVHKHELFGRREIDFAALYSRMFNVDPAEMLTSERVRLEIAQRSIQDRLAISIVVEDAGLGVKNDGRRGESPYARERSIAERDELDARAADTLEKLHLLRRYGVTPFEVPAEVIGLPYDIAVEPPLTLDADGQPSVAEGAVADFLFLPPGQERTGTGYTFQPSEENERAQRISVGGASIVMRLRLHDNGQVSNGFEFHNVPSDNTQKIFAENGATLAFEQIRGLMIALAFDALVPDTVVNSGSVGSVPNTMRVPQQRSPGSGITEMLLRRRRVLQQAGIRPGHTSPQEWEGPKMGIGGYVKRLPEGSRARPTANQEAIDYYRQALGIDYPGLPENHTFVGPYDRRINREVTFRRARFRRDAETRRLLGNL
jgi:hypothetical protein